MEKDEIKNCVCECVKWNEGNKVTQCHRCGRVIEKLVITRKAIENAIFAGRNWDDGKFYDKDGIKAVTELFESKGFKIAGS